MIAFGLSPGQDHAANGFRIAHSMFQQIFKINLKRVLVRPTLHISKPVPRPKAMNHDFSTDLGPSDDGVTCWIGAAVRIAKRAVAGTARHSHG